jgi:hypothetical protein
VIERVLIDVRLEGHAVFLRQRPSQALGFKRTHFDQNFGQFLARLAPLPCLIEVLR